ncbi:MAG: hypothetical protein G01um101456_244 [Parcubacteria group bacterium Gr01-1014_56]|nr:MAG: hypothetical protein G01um101456_244 [Parcubacteria group bacterium Gr01-1014_56]
MHLTTSFALALSAAFGVNQVQAPVQLSAPMPTVQTIEEYVRDYFIDEPLLADIAKCESRMRQFDKSGSVLRGEVVEEDLGLMQVNETYHGKTADKLGLDLYTTQGNLAYARYLYEKQGSTPWNSSKACWGKSKNNKSAPVVAINKTK